MNQQAQLTPGVQVQPQKIDGSEYGNLQPDTWIISANNSNKEQHNHTKVPTVRPATIEGIEPVFIYP